MNWGGAGYNSYTVVMKGDHSEAEQAAADQMRQQELNLMQQQLTMQMGQIGSVNSVLDPIIKAGGMSAEQQAALTNVAYNQLGSDFRSSQGQLNNELVARGMTGGMNAGSGQMVNQLGQLNAFQDYLKSNALSNIQLEKQQQLMQALGAKMGVAGMFGQNVGMFNQGAGGALNAGVQAAYNADQAQTSWMGPVFGALGAIGGAAAGPHP